MHHPVSAVIICKNEEKNIARCIQSLKLVSQDIVVIDSGSKDKTVEEAKRAGARVFIHKWQGYSKQKNLGNKYALHDFILSLDADEELSPFLANNIKREMICPKFDAYEFEFSARFGDKIIRHGGWHCERHTRLFRKSKTRWNDSLVHEKLVVDRLAIKHIPGYVYHYTAPTREYYREKMNRYAKEFAQNKWRLNKKTSPLKKYLSSSFRFIKEYFVQLGFLDGKAGLIIAIEEARYTYLKYKFSEKEPVETIPETVRGTSWQINPLKKKIILKD